MVAERKRPNTLMAAVRFFDPETAQAFVQSIKWPEGPICPRCGSVNVGFIKSRGRHQCRERECRKQFSLTTGTIMEATHLRMDQWLVAVWMIVNCRLGVSSCEIARTIGCKQQSAWHLLHRVRHLFSDPDLYTIRGACEIDEAFVGGLVKFMPHERRERARKAGNQGKTVVAAIKERGTNKIRAKVVPRASAEHVRPYLTENVARGARVYTDESPIYRWASKFYTHETINHRECYGKGMVHTNGCENFFNCLRRACKGTYIRPTPEHLGAYVDEAVFRFNVRDLSEWERFEAAMQLVVGKRLTYSKLTDGATR